MLGKFDIYISFRVSNLKYFIIHIVKEDLKLLVSVEILVISLTVVVMKNYLNII